jgi:secondary thiamine-phosphate synthase enzyme
VGKTHNYFFAGATVSTMITEHRTWSRHLPAEFGVWDITSEAASLTDDSGIGSGTITMQAIGSTAAITTIEYESGALADLQRALEAMAPAEAHYAHNDRWGDGNGFSHVRSALLKTGVSLPIIDGRLALGTWQQIVVINLDNRDRDREVVGMVMGSRA